MTCSTISRQHVVVVSGVDILRPNFKEWLAMIDGKLSKNSASTKTLSMDAHVMSKIQQALELLDSLVDCLVSAPHTTPNMMHLLIMNHATRHFCMQRIITTISIICFHLLIWAEEMLQGKTKDFQIKHESNLIHSYIFVVCCY